MTIQSYPPPISRPIFNSSDFEVVEVSTLQPFLYFPAAQGAMTFTSVEATGTLTSVQFIDAGYDVVADAIEVDGTIDSTSPTLIIGDQTETIAFICEELNINSTTITCNSPLQTTDLNVQNGLTLGVNSYITGDYSAPTINPAHRGFIKEGTFTGVVGTQFVNNVVTPIATMSLTNGVWFVTGTISCISVGASNLQNSILRLNVGVNAFFTHNAGVTSVASGTYLTQSANGYVTITGSTPQNSILNFNIRYTLGRWNISDFGYVFRAVKIA